MGQSQKTTTARLLRELNAKRGLKYPDIGYVFFADVGGDGRYCPRVYKIINADGGVTLSDLNGATARKRCDNIRAALES